MPLRSELTQLLDDVRCLGQLCGREHAVHRLRQREARLEEVCLQGRQLLLGRLQRSGIQAIRIQQGILQVLLGGPHVLPERLHRRAIGAERLLDVGSLVISQVEGMEQLPTIVPVT
jgi:hypothetical protein